VVGPTGDGEEMRRRKERLWLKRGRRMHPDGRSGGRPLLSPDRTSAPEHCRF
jgi:hypothetical protein